MRVIGIDPGSRITGYGIIDIEGPRSTYVACGALQLARQHDDLPQRLAMLHRCLTDVIEQYQPDVAAIERVFMAENPDSALKLGQGRGAALAALALKDLPITEYSAREIKQSLVGSGAAAKEQVQYMVTLLLKLDKTPQADAADALACALCHGNNSQGVGLATRLSTTKRGRGRRSSSWRGFTP